MYTTNRLCMYSLTSKGKKIRPKNIAVEHIRVMYNEDYLPGRLAQSFSTSCTHFFVPWQSTSEYIPSWVRFYNGRVGERGEGGRGRRRGRGWNQLTPMRLDQLFLPSRSLFFLLHGNCMHHIIFQLIKQQNSYNFYWRLFAIYLFIKHTNQA